MKFKNLLLAFSFIILQGGNLLAQNSDTLRVMSYNLRFGELATMKELAEYINSQNPDIVALQEVDWCTHRELAPHQNGVAMLNELAYYTGMFGIYGKSICYSGGYYGLGILSRYPVIASQRSLLPNPKPEKEQRSMLKTKIELPDNREVTFICTHLDVASDERRMAQLEYINQEVEKEGGAVILAGDFNANPDSEPILTQMEGWVNASCSEFTFSTKKPSVKIDYIYFKPDRGMRMLSTHRDTVKLSDHFPVITDLLIE